MGNVTLKLNIALSLVSCKYSMLVVVQNRRSALSFAYISTNGFHAKAKNERFTAASFRCRQNLKYEDFTSPFGRLRQTPFGRLRQNIAPKSVPHVQQDYFSSFNQSNHWFVPLSLTLPWSNLKLRALLLWMCLRGLNTVSSTYIWMGLHNYSLSLDATIMVSVHGIQRHLKFSKI